MHADSYQHRFKTCPCSDNMMERTLRKVQTILIYILGDFKMIFLCSVSSFPDMVKEVVDKKEHRDYV